MKSLVFWAGTDEKRAARLAAEGARFVLWHARGAEALKAAFVQARTPGEQLGQEDRDAVDQAAVDWTKQFGRRPLWDGQSLRALAEWKGVSLWWFAELYLHHSTEAPRLVRLIETFHRLLAAEAPDEVETVGLTPVEEVLLSRVCTARKVLYHGGGRVPTPAVGGVSRRSRWNTVKTFLGALKTALAGAPPGPDAGAPPVLFLSHAAFWRERQGPDGAPELYEHYFDTLIPGLAGEELRPYVVAVGPPAAFRKRGPMARLRDWLQLPRSGGPYVPISRYTTWEVWRETRRGTAQARALWQQLRHAPALREAFSHRGVVFADLGEEAFAATLLLQLPWAVRSYEESRAMLAAVQPRALCLYAESSGWGRAALAAAQAAGVPTVALQHGIIYPRYYSYLHEADEGACPRPTTTAVFGEAPRRFLVEQGRYAPESLVVTGSPKFDALLEASQRWDREELRARHGVAADEKLLVVASRHRPIRETHESIGSAFPALLRAVDELEGVHLLVKPHPAEPVSGYELDLKATGARRTRLLPASASLPELMHAADALVTVESLAAVEALVLGRPVVILNMPTNLRGLVEQGVAMGVPSGQDPLPALRSVLYDAATVEALGRAREAYVSDVAAGVDGRATARVLDLIRATAAETRPRAAMIGS